MALFKR